MISSKSIDYSSLPTIDLLFDPNQLFYHFGMVFVANCHWIQCENVLATVTLPAHHIRKTLLHARPVISRWLFLIQLLHAKPLYHNQLRIN